MILSDALSRAHLDNAKSEIPESEMERYVQSIVSHLPVSEQRWKQLQFETVKDSRLQILKGYTLHGWSSKIDLLVRNEISYHDDVLLKGQRVIIPSKMRPKIKSTLHEGKIGISRTKSNARNSMYWQTLMLKSLI